MNALVGNGTINFNPSPNASITLTLPVTALTQNVTFTGTAPTLLGQSGAPAQLLFQQDFTLSTGLYLQTLSSAGIGFNASVTAANWNINPGGYFDVIAGNGGTLSATGGSNLTGYSGGSASVTFGTCNLNSILGAVIIGGNGGSVTDQGGTGDQGGQGGVGALVGNSLTLTNVNGFSIDGGRGGAVTDTATGTPTGGIGGNASVSLTSLQGVNSYLYLNGGQGGTGSTGGAGGSVMATVGNLALTQSAIYMTASDGNTGLGAGGAGGSASLSIGSLSETQNSGINLTGGTGENGTSSAANGGSAMVQGASATLTGTGTNLNLYGGYGGSLGTIPGTTAAPGGNGGNASVSISSFSADVGAFISLNGGNGGTGGSPASAGPGGNGGNGGSVTLNITSLSMGTSVQLFLHGGAGGVGGNGSTGGNGGAGGNASVTLSSLALGTSSLFSALAGSGGVGGTGGVNGTGGACDAAITTLTGSGTLDLSGPSGASLLLTNGNFSGNITTANLLVQSSGFFTLNGTANVSSGAVLNGTLNLGNAPGMGSLSGPVSVAPGGELSGCGRVYGTVTNEGVVYPDGAVTLTMNQFNQTAGGTLNTNLYPGNISGALQITTGANLNGILDPSYASGNYGFRDRYQIISGAPVTGTFSLVSIFVPNMAGTVLYGSDAVTLVIYQNHSPFASYAQNANETAVSSTLDASLLTCSDALAFKMGELNALSSGQAGVLNQMGGVIYTALPEALLNQAQYEDGLIFNHMGTGAASGPNLARLVLPGNPLSGESLAASATSSKKSTQATANPGDSSPEGFWLETTGSFGSSEPTSQVSAFNISNYGLVGGYDWILERGLSLGLLGGYLQSTVQPADGSANANITGAQFGLYGRAAFGDFGLAFLGGYVADHFNADRSIIMGADTNSLTGSFNGDQIQAALQMDAHLSDVGSTFRPFWGFLYAHLSEDAFSETGSDSLALSLPALAYDSFRAYAGLEETFNFSLGKDSMLSPRLHATASKDLISLDPAFQTSFNGAPDNPFQIGGIVPDGTDFGLGGGVNLSLGPAFDLFADFDGHFTSTGNLSTVTGGMSLNI